jgi:ribonuclease D
MTLPLPREAVEVVSSEAQLMDIQWTAAVYGVDTEWLPSITRFERGYLTILTIASLEVTLTQRVWLFDVVQLKDNPVFIDKVAELFSDESKTKLAMGFQADLPQLASAGLPLEMRGVVDLQDLFKRLEPKANSGGLAGLCSKYLKVPMCKQMQITDWSRRPLNEAQIHYAALDAFVLLTCKEQLVYTALATLKKKPDVGVDSAEDTD